MCVHVLAGERPVLLVWRDREDGTFGLACGRGDHDAVTIDDWAMAHVFPSVHADPAVNIVRTLPRGAGAQRDRPGAPWRRIDRRP